MVAEVKSQHWTVEGTQEWGQQPDTHLNVRRFLFEIRFTKGIILTSDNTADGSQLTSSSRGF